MHETELRGRVLDAHAWFQSHGRFLVREFADQGLDQSLDPASVRLAVFGLDFLASTLRDLERLALAELQVFEFCSFTVGGELRVGVTALMGGETGPQPGEASVQTADFRVPSGLPPGPAAERCAFFLDLVQRMDPRVTACGDRFSRQIRLHGTALVLPVFDTRQLEQFGLVVGKRRTANHVFDVVGESAYFREVSHRAWRDPYRGSRVVNERGNNFPFPIVPIFP